jgi:hypothetical protein
MEKIVMMGPLGWTTCTIEGGHQYTNDGSGKVKLVSPTHLETMKLHGFTQSFEDEKVTEEQILAMDEDELTEFVEERGGTVADGTKKKGLRFLALNAGGFPDKAKEYQQPLDRDGNGKNGGSKKKDKKSKR